MGHARRKFKPQKHVENSAVEPKLQMGWILIFKAISEPLAVIDRFGWVIFANTAWENLIGVLENSGERVHITRHLPAFAGLAAPAGVHEVADRPMVLKDVENRMISVLVSARVLPDQHALVVQARPAEHRM